MILKLKETTPDSLLYEAFMGPERRVVIMKALFMTVFRQTIYHGTTVEALAELAEVCQTIEELTFAAYNLEKTECFVGKLIEKDKKLALKIVLLGVTPEGELIAEKEKFLRDIERNYGEVTKNL